MFCSNCGCACADGTKFCSNCGTTLQKSISTPQINHAAKQAAPGDVSYSPPVSAASITISEYYNLFPSPAEAKRQKILKRLFYISAVILFVLLALNIGFCIYDIILFKSFGIFVDFYAMPFVLNCVFIFGTLYFTKTGIAKRSPYRLFASIILGFWAGELSYYISWYFILFSRCFAIVICALHIAMLVINLKSVKEFKANAGSIQ